jgi:hypothetical protein
MPGILWQNYLTNGKVWDEQPIPDLHKDSEISMVYPGEDAWDGTVSVGSGEYKPILGGYKING